MFLRDNKKQVVAQVKALLADGLNYMQIAPLMAKEGYKNRTGKPINRQDLSYFMIEHGGTRLKRVRADYQGPKKARRKYTKSGKFAKAKADVSIPRPKGRSILQDVEDIVTSNLAPELKERMLKAVVS